MGDGSFHLKCNGQKRMTNNSSRINTLFEERVPLCAGDIKTKELFGDMDNLKEQAKPLIEYSRRQGPKEERLVKMIFGLLENEAVKTVDIPGIGIIDKSIADIVSQLNNLGYKTLSSCSGVRDDHSPEWESKKGYLSFCDTLENRALAVKIPNIEQYTPERGYTYLQPSFTLRFDEQQLPNLIHELQSLCSK